MSVLTEIIAIAAIGIVAAAAVEICRQCLNEYENWRQCGGRSAFWPLMH